MLTKLLFDRYPEVFRCLDVSGEGKCFLHSVDVVGWSETCISNGSCVGHLSGLGSKHSNERNQELAQIKGCVAISLICDQLTKVKHLVARHYLIPGPRRGKGKSEIVVYLDDINNIVLSSTCEMILYSWSTHIRLEMGNGARVGLAWPDVPGHVTLGNTSQLLAIIPRCPRSCSYLPDVPDQGQSGQTSLIWPIWQYKHDMAIQGPESRSAYSLLPNQAILTLSGHTGPVHWGLGTNTFSDAMSDRIRCFRSILMWRYTMETVDAVQQMCYIINNYFLMKNRI